MDQCDGRGGVEVDVEEGGWGLWGWGAGVGDWGRSKINKIPEILVNSTET